MWTAANITRHRATALRMLAFGVAAIALLTPAIAAGDGGPVVPPAPNGVAVTGSSTTSISLSWSSSANALDYKITRDGKKVAFTTGTGYTISSLQCGATFTLGVTARGAGTQSPETRVSGSTSSCGSSGGGSGGGGSGGGTGGGGSTGGGTTSGSLTFNAVADARIDEAAPGSNYGGSASLRTEGGSDPDEETFLRFAVSGLSGAVVSAKLRLYAISPTSDGPRVFATGDWSEGGITFSNHPSHGSGALADVGIIANGAWVEYDLTSHVKANGTYNLALASTSSDGVDFASRERGNGPQLLVKTSGSSGGGSTGGGGDTGGGGGGTDTLAPSAPTPLSVTGASTTSISVSWPAATDNVGVTGYGAYVGSTLAASLTGRSYTFSNLTCGTSVTLAVDAADAAGNRSAKAQVTAATAACSEPPTGSCAKVASPGSGAAQALVESLSSGQVGCLRGGTYTTSGDYVLDVKKSNVTIMSYPGERAVLRGVVQVKSGANGVRLSRLWVEGTNDSNTVKVYAADFVLEDSDITNGWRDASCLMMGSNSGSGQALRPIIRRNRFHECGKQGSTLDHGIYASNVKSGQIVDNVFWNIAGYSIQLYPNSQNVTFAHNVIDGGSPSTRGGVIFGGDGSFASANNVVEYNVITYAKTYNITATSQVGGGNIARSNCVYGGSGGNIASSGFTSQNNVTADPLFVNRSGRDYRLAANSPCLAVVGYDTAARLP